MSENGQAKTARIHSRVYEAIVGLSALYLIAAWFAFSGPGRTEYLLVVVTGFVAFCIGLVEASRRVGEDRPETRTRRRDDFRRWMRSRVDVADKPIRGYDAAIEILLPLAAVAFGMLAFGILTLILG